MTNKYVGAAKFIKNLITGGKQKTTGTEVITCLKGKYNIRKKKKKSWKDRVDTSHPSYKREYEGL